MLAPAMNERQIKKQENRLFFNRWIQHPARLGTVAPISVKLADLAASFVNSTDCVVEIGAGTGRLTRSLLKTGLNQEQFWAIELDHGLCQFLKESLPFIKIIEGNACYMDKLLPQHIVGEVDTVVSAIPLMYLNPADRVNLIKACFKILKPGGKIVHVTYSPKSPMDIDCASYDLHLNSKRLSQVWANLPPGFVWEYTQFVP